MQRRRARSTPYLIGVVVGVGVGAGGGIGSGAGADEDLEAAVLGPRHGAGGSRPAAASVSQSSTLLLLRGAGALARACVSGVWGRNRTAVDGRSAPSASAARLVCLRLRRLGLFACGCCLPVQLCTAFLYFWLEASLLLGPSAALSAPSLCVSLSRLE